MASTGPNTAQPHSSFICPSFTLSLHSSFVPSLTQLSVYVHKPLCPCFLYVLLFLCSFFHPIHRFSICTLHASFSISLSCSLFPCLPPSLNPSPSRRRATSVELIRYSRHIWTALTGINHEHFEVPMQGSSDCL